MSEKEFSQSINISGGQISGFQIDQAGRDITQNQMLQSKRIKDSIELIKQLEELLYASNLSKDYIKKAVKYLDTAKAEVEEQDPDREFMAQSLQRAIKVLDDASETSETGLTLWRKIKPVADQLLHLWK